MKASSFRDRIEQRIRDLDLNVREVERLCDFSPSHLSDIMSGRKKTLKEDALSSLAKTLKTTVVWLLHGLGPMSTDPTDVREADVAEALHRAGVSLGENIIDVGVISAGELESMSILLTALDLRSGECCFFLGSVEASNEIGCIIDPALRVSGNEYARGFAERRFISVSAKKLVKKDGSAIYAIVDAKK